MERISLEVKQNFFEGRVSNYSMSGVGNKNLNMEFNIDDDF